MAPRTPTWLRGPLDRDEGGAIRCVAVRVAVRPRAKVQSRQDDGLASAVLIAALRHVRSASGHVEPELLALVRARQRNDDPPAKARIAPCSGVHPTLRSLHQSVGFHLGDTACSHGIGHPQVERRLTPVDGNRSASLGPRRAGVNDRASHGEFPSSGLACEALPRRWPPSSLLRLRPEQAAQRPTAAKGLTPRDDRVPSLRHRRRASGPQPRRWTVRLPAPEGDHESSRSSGKGQRVRARRVC